MAYDASDEEIVRALVSDYPDMGLHDRAGQMARICRMSVLHDPTLQVIPDEVRDREERMSDARTILDYLRDCGCDAQVYEGKLHVYWALPGLPDYELDDEVKRRIRELAGEISELVLQ